MPRQLSPLLALFVALAGCGDGDETGSITQPAPDCHEMECYRPYVCAERCDGETTNNGCCQCPEGQLDVIVDCPHCGPGCEVVCVGDEASSCRCRCGGEPEEAEREEGETPTDRPCTADEECMAVTDCDCDCVARARANPLPEGEAWQTMCDGQPPPNCGAQSPCASFTARCDTEVGRCVVEDDSE